VAARSALAAHLDEADVTLALRLPSMSLCVALLGDQTAQVGIVQAAAGYDLIPNNDDRSPLHS